MVKLIQLNLIQLNRKPNERILEKYNYFGLVSFPYPNNGILLNLTRLQDLTLSLLGRPFIILLCLIPDNFICQERVSGWE